VNKWVADIESGWFEVVIRVKRWWSRSVVDAFVGGDCFLWSALYCLSNSLA
jgi:hypothetical protein